MHIIFDGWIYQNLSRGGIARMYTHLLPLLAVNPHAFQMICQRTTSINFIPKELCQFVYEVYGVRMDCRPWRLRRSVAPAINRLVFLWTMKIIKPDIVIDSYYRLPRTGTNIKRITVIYDMIQELFPNSYNDAAGNSVRLTKKNSVQTADAVICISESTMTDAVKYYGLDPSICFVAYLAAGTGFALKQQRSCAAQPFLLYVGDFRAFHKNFRTLLQAFAFLRCSLDKLRLKVVSSDAPNQHEVSEFSFLCDMNSVDFCVKCSDEMLCEYYNACECFVCPSLYEGFGIPILEALTCGAPVACSGVSSIPEVGKDAVHYFDPENAKNMSDSILQAIQAGRTPELVASRISHANTFTWRRTADVFLNVFDFLSAR